MKLPSLCFLAFFILSGLAAQTVSSNTASLSGRILDDAGHPLAAKLTAFRMTSLDGFAEAEQQCDTTADEQGRFECKRLPAGKYIVRVSTGAREFYYPAAAEIEAAEFISLREGELGWAQVQTHSPQLLDVSGTFPKQPAAAAFALKVRAGPWLLNLGIPVRYDGNAGQFKISQLESGDYELTERWSKGGLQHESKLAFTVENLPLKDLRIQDDQLVQISGHLSTHQGIGEIAQIILQRLDGTNRDVRATIRDDVFQFEPVPAGQYALALPSTYRAYVVAITSGGKTSPGPSLAVEAGQSPISIVVQLAQPAIELQGSVTEWTSPEKRATVVAQSEDSGEISVVENERKP